MKLTTNNNLALQFQKDCMYNVYNFTFFPSIFDLFLFCLNTCLLCNLGVPSVTCYAFLMASTSLILIILSIYFCSCIQPICILLEIKTHKIGIEIDSGQDLN